MEKRILLFLLTLLLTAGVAGEVRAAGLDQKKASVLVSQELTLTVNGFEGKIKWNSSDKKVAKVSKEGVVTGRRKGKTVITARAGKKVWRCKVTVRAGLDPDTLTLYPGESESLRLLGTKTKSFQSSAPAVADIGTDGTVTAKAAGTAEIVFRGKDKKKYTCPVTVKAWRNVVFESNGGSAVEPQRLKEEEIAVEPAAPVREGYRFDGWYSDPGLTQSFDFSAAPAGDVTLYARWQEEPHLDVSGNNAFGWRFFSVLDPKENQFFSPYGLAQALTMPLNGAVGETAGELASAIGFADAAEADHYFGTLNASLLSSADQGGPTVGVGNLMLVNSAQVPGTGVLPEFQKTLSDTFGASVEYRDFAEDLDGTKAYIRDWVKEQTHDFIPDYASVLDSDAISDLLNVVYFKGKWPEEVREDFTDPIERTFYDQDGSETTYPDFMRTLDRYRYYTDGKFRGLRLPYESGDGSPMSMILILPADGGTGVGTQWAGESAAYREAFVQSVCDASTVQANLILPKFSLDVSVDAASLLPALGVRRLFTNDSQIPNVISGQFLKVTGINHRAKIQVDEEGTEAAAVTEVVMAVNAAPGMQEPEQFICDRPFVFLIREETAGTDLFVGVLNTLEH